MTLVRRVALLLLVAGTALAGCADPAEHGGGLRPGTWNEPARYTYVLDSQCGERLLIGKFKVTVADGAVTDVEGLDESAKRATESPAIKAETPTLNQIVKRVADAEAKGAHKARVEFDKTDGHPTYAEIDRLKNAIDDEECYTVSDYQT
jgi:hypothetical protein